MTKSKLLLIASMALTLVANLMGGAAQEAQIKEEVQLALEEPKED